MRDPATDSRDAALAPPLGHFHELTLPTPDIRRSVEFYERLGFTQALTGDVWLHPYGVLTDGRIVVGLHQEPGREGRFSTRELRRKGQSILGGDTQAIHAGVYVNGR